MSSHRSRFAFGRKDPIRAVRSLRSEQLENRWLCTAQGLGCEHYILATANFDGPIAAATAGNAEPAAAMPSITPATTLQAAVPSFKLTGTTSATFTAGQTVTFQWTAANVDAGSTISLAYDTTSNWGNPKWIEVDGVSAANGAGSYSWKTTGVTPGTYYLEGYLDDAGKPCFSNLASAITITTAAIPSFTLTGPSSGTFAAGQAVTFQWTAANVGAGSTISLACDTTGNWGNPKWIEVDGVTAANGAGSYTWNTTGVAPGTYYLEGYLYDAGQACFSSLASAITITTAAIPSFTLTGPSSGTFAAGQTVTFQWTAANVGAGSTISLASDTTGNWGNPKWIEVDGVTAANGAGSYTWNTTGIAPGTYYLEGYLYDAGQACFSSLMSAITITTAAIPGFTLNNPTSTTFSAGQSVTFQWTDANVDAGSKISLAYDTTSDWGNPNWIEVDGVTAANGAGSYTWNTTGVAPGTYHLEGYLYDAGKAYFSNLSTAITITSTVVPSGFQDPALGSLVQSLDADGSIGRNDMITILRSVGTGGSISSADFADLQTLLTDAAQYNIPGYVQVLADDVVKGNPANANYQGQPLGNLAAGSSATRLNDLINKWFLGADLPALNSSSYSYQTTSGTLFPSTPSHLNEYQGELGDCYLISSLGAIADSNPAAIENMFINNGDGTYTVRFYDNGTADYVTVNSSLPTYNGQLVYADYGFRATNSANSLWIPLAEKAYAQWNETGNEGRNGTNTYAGIEGGWMGDVDAQVLGHDAGSYALTASTKATMTAAISSAEAVTIGTQDSSSLPYGLYGDHAYAVIGYNASTDLFTLYNPWGMDQPQPLTWSEIEATCTEFAVTSTSGSVPIAGANLHSATGADQNAGTAAVFWTKYDQHAKAETIPATLANTSGYRGPATPALRRLPAAGVDTVLARPAISNFDWLPLVARNTSRPLFYSNGLTGLGCFST